MTIMSYHIDNINKKKLQKKIQIEIMELKSTITEIKTSLEVQQQI